LKLARFIIIAASAAAALPMAHCASTGASFLTIDPSARTSALGNAGNAIVGDSSSLFINPAGLGHSMGSEMMTTYSRLFMDSSYSSIGFVHSLNSLARSSALGVSVVYLNYGSFDGHSPDSSSSGSFGASDMALGLSYGLMLGAGVTAGVTARAIQEQIETSSARTVSFDAGMQIPMPLKGLALGLALRNAGPGVKFINERAPLLTSAEMGFGFTIGRFVLMSNAVTTLSTGKSNFGFGTELQLASGLNLRTGYLLASEERTAGSAAGGLSRWADFSAGIGLHLGRYQFDYSFVPHAELGVSQFFTMSARFAR